MGQRKLTGRWFLKKKLFGYSIIVETIQTYTSNYDLGVSESPEFTVWEKAKPKDLIELGIITVF